MRRYVLLLASILLIFSACAAPPVQDPTAGESAPTEELILGPAPWSVGIIHYKNADYLDAGQHLLTLPEEETWSCLGEVHDSAAPPEVLTEDLQSDRPDWDGKKVWASDLQKGFLFLEEEDRFLRLQTEIHRCGWISHGRNLYLAAFDYQRLLENSVPADSAALPEGSVALGTAVLKSYAVPAEELETNSRAAWNCQVFTSREGDVLYVSSPSMPEEEFTCYYLVTQPELDALFPDYFGE